MGKKRPPTMQDVADAVGVSVSTVSRVFNAYDFGTDETRTQIIKTADNLGYSRLRRRENVYPAKLVGNGAARRGDGTVHNIVLLAPESLLNIMETTGWIYTDVVPALQRAAREHGFHLILSSYGGDNQWGSAALSARHIGGVVWMAHDRQEILPAISRSVPLVVLNADSFWPQQTNVQANDRSVLFKAVEHLAGLGHRRVAFFDVDESPARPTRHCQVRLEAYREALGDFRLDSDPALCIREQFGRDEHPQAVARAMDRMMALPSPPTALIAPLTYSIQFLKETRKRSVHVPDDLSIVAIDNAPAAELVDPSLTVVDCVFGRCAEIAIELLLEGTSWLHKEARTIMVEPQLIVRRSTAGPNAAEVP